MIHTAAMAGMVALVGGALSLPAIPRLASKVATGVLVYTVVIRALEGPGFARFMLDLWTGVRRGADN